MNTKIHWIETNTAGKIGIMPRPRGGDQLGTEVKALNGAEINTIVSLLTASESFELELNDEAEECRKRGIEFLAFPIKDRQVPSLDFPLVTFLCGLADKLAQGEKIVIHCRMGVGRAAIMAAGTLVLCGVEPDMAFAVIRKARGCEVPDTIEQRQWVFQFAKNYSNIQPLSDLWV